MTKKSGFLLFGMSLMLASAVASGQTPVASTVRVFTDPPSSGRFMVDGTTYFGSQVFTWPRGSKHVIEFPLKVRADGTVETFQESLDQGSRFGFGGWTDSNGLSYGGLAAINVVADPTLTFVRASVTPTYRLSVRFSSYPTDPTCSVTQPIPQDFVRTGFLVVNGVCYGADAETYVSGGTLNLQAIPFPGSVFLGWSVNGSTSTNAFRTLPLNGPVTIAAQFTQSKRVQFFTDPPSLQVLVDRTAVITSGPATLPDDRVGRHPTCQTNLNLPPNPPITIPVLCFGEFDFVPGSRHTIGAASPQYTPAGQMLVFDKFSNGMGDNSVLTVGNDVATRDLITAKFVQGVNASFLTNPPNLKLNIDGRDTLFLNYNFAWGIGHSHTVEAPLEQRDSKGRRWTFKGWSNGGTAKQTFTVTEPIRWTAEYESLPQVTITSTPNGLPIRVDNTDCMTPCTLDRAAGTEVRVSAYDTLPTTPQSRMEFQGWTDSGERTRTVRFDQNTQSFTAMYLMAHQVSAFADPSSGVTFVYTPPSETGYYLADTAVTVRADVKNGYKFKRWEGDLSGSYNQGTLVVTGPRTVLAKLDRVPFIPPAGIRNAAGETPENTVAPGSIISIVGESLASAYEAGRTNPLPQTLGNVTVRVGDSLLPLLWVSPTEIRAQVLSTLPDGEHELRVRWEGNPEVTGKFVIARNSPGLFNRDEEPVAMATREDGSQVTPNSPAKRGELVTLYGTGFGPYERVIIDGFLNPITAANPVVDRVEIFAGDRLIVPEFSGQDIRSVGMAFTKFRVPSDMDFDASTKIRVVVNGKNSNSVSLPIE